MSLVNSGFQNFPGLIGRISGTVYNSSFTMDEANDHCGAIVRIPKTGTLLKIGFMTSTVTVSDTLRLALEGIDGATGRPDGTVTPTGASGTQASLSASTCYWVALNGGAGVSVTKGNQTAITCRYNSYVAGNLSISHTFNGFSVTATFPYTYTYNNTGTVWAFQATSPNFAFEYSDGSIVPIYNCLPACNYSNVDFNNTSNPDRRGLRFSQPFAFAADGIGVSLDSDNGSRILLYDSDGTTLLEDVTIDGEIRGSAANGIQYIPFSQTRIFTKDTFYRVIVLPNSATNNRITLLTVTNDSANAAMAGIDGGVNFHYTTCNGAPSAEGSWTQTLTSRPMIFLVGNQLDDGAGGGGGGTTIVPLYL